MNIEKIKNYNQKMLAAISTILVVMAAIGLIAFLVFLISQIIPHRDQQTNALLSDDKVEQLKQNDLRKQIISFDSPALVDTPNLIYLIPVNVKTLDKPENANKKVLDLASSNYEGSPYKQYSGMEYYGAFNNLLVYEYPKNITYKICDKRIIGTDFRIEYFNDEIIIVFTGADKDTDDDGKITLNDFNSLFVYSLPAKKLRIVNFKNSTVNSYKYVTGKKDILITFGFDRNNDNLYDADTEPSFVMRYDYKLDTLVPVVEKKLEGDIQKIIDKE